MNADRGYDSVESADGAPCRCHAAYSMERRVQVLDEYRRPPARRGGRARRRVWATRCRCSPPVDSARSRCVRRSDPSTEVDVNAIERVVSPGYFSALGLRLSVRARRCPRRDTMSRAASRSWSTGRSPPGTWARRLSAPWFRIWACAAATAIAGRSSASSRTCGRDAVTDTPQAGAVSAVQADWLHECGRGRSHPDRPHACGDPVPYAAHPPRPRAGRRRRRWRSTR